MGSGGPLRISPRQLDLPMANTPHLTLHSMKGKVSDAEWKVRVDLAACYRLVAHYEMSDMMANHISAAAPNEENAFLINASPSPRSRTSEASSFLSSTTPW